MESCSSNHNGSNELMEAPCEVPHSPHAHAQITVINGQQHLDPTMLKNTEQASNAPCSTPKKMPAKILYRKDSSGSTTSDIKEGSNRCSDASFKEFLATIKLAQQDTRYLEQQKLQQQQFLEKNGMKQGSVAPQQRRSSGNMTEYSSYEEARYQRIISLSNSFSNLNLSPPSPGAEWVSGRPSPQVLGGGMERSWDQETLIAHHAFPPSIFCTSRSGEGGIPPPPSLQELNYPRSNNANASDLSDTSVIHQEHVRRQSFQDSSSSSGSSTPSAAALSGESSSEWSEEEQMGVRKFLRLIEQRNAASGAQPQHYHCQPPKLVQPPPSEVTMVEISPGVSEPLRKADETIVAVRNDFYVPVSCFGCTQDIFCIADAKYVICPTCRVVSPIEEGALDGQVLTQHGLGLGFTCESLFQIQSEILSER